MVIGLPLCAGLWVARHAPRLVLPLEVLATVAFLLLMWETRLVPREALNAIRGRGTIVAMRQPTSTGMRSVVVVLYVVRYSFPGTNVHMIPIDCCASPELRAVVRRNSI